MFVFCLALALDATVVENASMNKNVHMDTLFPHHFKSSLQQQEVTQELARRPQTPTNELLALHKVNSASTTPFSDSCCDTHYLLP